LIIIFIIYRYFRYNYIGQIKYEYSSKQIPIDAGFLKLSKTLKKL